MDAHARTRTQRNEVSTERRENKRIVSNIINSTICFAIKFRQIGNTFTK